MKKTKRDWWEKKVRIENAEMRVIKWEKIWNDYRKRKNGERERATHDTYYDYEPNRFLFFIIYYLIIIK